ncbi:MAG: YceD family protein [Syntrophothermus sp.]
MKVNISRILPEKGASMDIDLSEPLQPLKLESSSRRNDGDGELRYVEPVWVVATVNNSGKCIVVRGRVSTRVEATCHRCLDRFQQEISVPFEEEFFRKGAQARHAGEEEEQAPEEPDEPDLRYFHGDEIDLAPTAVEALSLALPIKLLCREDCRGLCPHCGTNLNEKQCDCQLETLDPRMAVLKDLLREKKV